MALRIRAAAATVSLLLLSALAGPLAGQTLRPQIAPDTTRRLVLPVSESQLAKSESYLEGLITRLGIDTTADAARSEARTAFADAARFARDHLDSLERALRLFAMAPDLAQGAATSGDSPTAIALRHAQVAAIALQASQLKRLVAAVNSADTVSIKEDARFIESRLTSAKGRIIMGLVADGTIRQSLDQGGTSGSGGGSAGTGSFGFGITFPNRWRVSASLGVASSVDTVKSLHGSTVLIPGSGRGALSNVLVEVESPAFLPLGPVHLGMRGYFFGTNSAWQVDSTHVDTSGVTPVTDTIAIADDIAILGVGLGVEWELLPGRTLLSQPVGLTFNLGAAARFIRGNGQDRRGLLKPALGGATATSYFGVEGGIRADFGLIAAQAQYYFMTARDADGHPIRGLSRGQLVIGFSVQGPIVKGPLD